MKQKYLNFLIDFNSTDEEIRNIQYELLRKMLLDYSKGYLFGSYEFNIFYFDKFGEGFIEDFIKSFKILFLDEIYIKYNFFEGKFIYCFVKEEILMDLIDDLESGEIIGYINKEIFDFLSYFIEIDEENQLYSEKSLIHPISYSNVLDVHKYLKFNKSKLDLKRLKPNENKKLKTD